MTGRPDAWPDGDKHDALQAIKHSIHAVLLKEGMFVIQEEFLRRSVTRTHADE